MNNVSMNGLVIHFWVVYAPVVLICVACEAMNPNTVERARRLIGRDLSALAAIPSEQFDNALMLALSRAEKAWMKLFYALAYALPLSMALLLSDFLESVFPL